MRSTLLQRANIIFSVLFILTTANAPLPIDERIYCSLFLVLGAIITSTLLAYSTTAKGQFGRSIALVFAGYYFVGCIIKLPLLLFFPDQIDAPGSIPEHVFSSTLATGLTIFVMGYAGATVAVLSIGTFISPSKKQTLVATITTDALRLLIFLSVALVFLKGFLQTTFDIAIPGLPPKPMPIPFLTGALAFITIISTFLSANVALFYSLITRRRAYVLSALIVVFGNVFLDLRVGSKYSVMYEMFVLCWYYWLNRSRGPLRQREYLTIAISSMVVALFVSFYKYINIYRFNLLAGLNYSEAITAAINSSDTTKASSVLSILNRINGIDTIISSTYLLKGYDLSIFELLTDGAVNAVRHAIYGVGYDDVHAAFGTTQFVPPYLAFGYAGVFIFFVFLGAFFLFFKQTLEYRCRFRPGLFLAIHPVLLSEFVKIIFSSGNFDFIAKGLLSFVLTVYVLNFFSRLSFRTTPHRYKHVYS